MTENMMNLRVGQTGVGRVTAGDDGVVVAGETSIGGPPSPTGLRYTSDKHPRLALANINMLQKRRELCDVVLIVGGRKIFAHRSVYLFIYLFFYSFIEFVFYIYPFVLTHL